jgi:hypothetical protein
MYIITGQHGIGADIINACIDTTDIDFIPDRNFLSPSLERSLLINHDDEVNNVKKDYQYIMAELAAKYKSAETCFDKKRLEPKSNIHTYIFVDCSSELAFEWLSTRLEFMGSTPDSFSLRQTRNVAVIQRHFSDFTISLEDILQGNMIQVMSTFIKDVELDEKLYKSWLKLMMYDTPF